MIIHLGDPSPDLSSDLPGNSIETGRLVGTIFDLAPCGVCPAFSVTRKAVRSYRTFSPLPVASKMQTGGIFSVALSLESLPVPIKNHTALWSSDFPPAFQQAIISPSPTLNLCPSRNPLLFNRDLVLLQFLIQIASRCFDFLRCFRNIPVILF